MIATHREYARHCPFNLAGRMVVTDQRRSVKIMQRFTLFCLFCLFLASAPLTPAQGLLNTITVPEKAVAVVNQSLVGTWLLELRRPGAPATQPTVLNLITFQPDGTAVASTSDGALATNHGVWARVGDRRFLQTMFVFAFNEARVLTTLTKVRINVLVSVDGKSVKGTTEVAVLDRDGRVMVTIPGGTYTGVRLSPEIPADFYTFQTVE